MNAQKMKWSGLLVVLGLSSALVSCNNGGDGSENQNPDEGIFSTNLSALNATIAGETSGQAIIRIRDGKLDVYLGALGTPASIAHAQHIHLGGECPTEASDANGEGFVDVAEGLPAYGPILVNLDTDLSSFAAAADTYPVANGEGAYVYKESADFSGFLTDLRRTDENADDAIATLAPTDAFAPGTRVIVVHGVGAAANLPDTVATIADLPRESTLPIACGKIKRVSAEEEAALEAILDAAE